MNFVKGAAKAVVAGLVAGISFATPVVDDGVVPSEALGIAGAFLAAFIAVYFVENTGPNAPSSGTLANEDAAEQPPLW